MLCARLLLVTILLLCLGCRKAEPEAVRVAFGVMVPAPERPGSGRLYETRKVPMTGSMQPGFAFLIHPSDDDPYDVYSVHHLPAPPAATVGDVSRVSGHSTDTIYRTSVTRAQGIRRFDFGFSPGDPLGRYRVEVFVNGALAAEIPFEAVAPSDVDEVVKSALGR